MTSGDGPHPVHQLGDLIAAAYAGGAGEDATRVYWDAFGAYWQGEVMPVLEAGMRPPVVDGYREYVQGGSIRPQIAALLGAGHPTLAPDPVGLQSATAAEPAVVDSVVAPQARGTLPEVAWADVASAVLVPRWRYRAEAHERAVAGMTVAGAGPAATDPLSVAERLVTPEQRAEVEEHLYATGVETLQHAVAVALIDAGGEVDHRLGEPWAITVGGTRFEPWRELTAIANGEAAPPGWVARCSAAGVADLPLARA